MTSHVGQRPTLAVPSFAEETDRATDSATQLQRSTEAPTVRRPFLVGVAGGVLGSSYELAVTDMVIGRSPSATVSLLEHGVSRKHAVLRVADDGGVTIEDLQSSNGTFVNGRRVVEPVRLAENDKVRLGADVVFKFTLQDDVDQRYQQFVNEAVTGTGNHAALLDERTKAPWTPESWRERPMAQAVSYDDPKLLEVVMRKLHRLPPLVTSGEIEALKSLIAEAQEGRRFLLQGGDCAETLDDCEPSVLTNKLKILIQMSLVLIRGARRPVIRVGRFAGQYAKPRSRPTETRNGVELPSYFGDMVNRPAFDAESRRPDPQLLLQCYLHATATLNFVRSMSAGGFADLRRPEYFDLEFFQRADLPERLRDDYQRMCREITEGLNFIHSVGDRSSDDMMKVNFFSSHEALSLLYESAQTRKVPRRDGFYDLTTHLPWIGERTRGLDGAHIDFFRGIENPVGVKLGPTVAPEEAIELCRTLNPGNTPGKLVLITRMGANNVLAALPKIVDAVTRAGRRVLWVCDPMHGNAITSRSGVKTRDFDDILREVLGTIEVHRKAGSYLGGVHFEMTGEDVTECIGGGLTEDDLDRNYVTACDPRLNYRQAIEMAFCIARELKEEPRPPSAPPRSRAR